MKKILTGIGVVLFAVALVVTAEEAKKEAAPKADAAKKVLSIKDGVAMECACPADCKCTVKADDPTKCSCGKAVEKVDLKGKFVCEKCLVIADKAGKCPKCQADLVEVKAKEAAKDAPKDAAKDVKK
jgi:hypothetical protein